MSYLKNNQEDDLEEIKEGFEMFDVENKGLLDPLELRETMEEMNLKDKNPFIYELISSLCENNDVKSKGGLTSEDFILYLKNKIGDVESEKGVKIIFNAFSDLDNKIPMPTFYQAAREVGDEEGGVEIKDLVEKSKTGGKEIDFDEFYDIMREENPKDYSNKKNKNKTKEKYDKKNNDFENENNYKKSKKSQSYIERGDDNEPKSGIVIVEKKVIENLNNQPNKINKYGFGKDFGFDKEENNNHNNYEIKNKKYTYQSKKINNENEIIEHNEIKEKTKRYHRNIGSKLNTEENQTNNNRDDINSLNRSSDLYGKFRKKI